ncbi:hypothetical protein, partial [Thiolapillus sp.]
MLINTCKAGIWELKSSLVSGITVRPLAIVVVSFQTSFLRLSPYNLSMPCPSCLRISLAFCPQM